MGAALDSSVASVFKTAVTLAQGAEKAIQKGKRETATAAESEARRELRAKERATKAAEALDRQRAAGLYRVYREQEAAAEKASKAEIRSRERTEQAVRRELDKTMRAMVVALEREERARARIAARAGESFARRTSHRATRFLSGGPSLVSAAGGAVRNIATGMGIDTSLSGAIARGVDIDAAAVALSNRGHIAGSSGPNGQVVDPSALAAQARAVGKEAAIDPRHVLEAGKAFVGLTGDLDLWRKIMPDVVKQTAALGGNQEEAAKAAGEFAAHIGDMPNKEKAVLDLMRVAAGQGKIGGVDFSDFAKYASRAAAPAAMFEGDKAQNISKLTALAEIAKMHGGASNAAEAFTSIASLTNTLKKPARFKSIKALLGNETGQYADAEHTILRDPVALMRSLVIAGARGNKDGRSSLDRVAKALGDARSLKAISGLQATYNEAGGGKAGEAAIDAELKKFAGAVMTEEETHRALAKQLQTTKSRAEIFNQSLENVAHGAMERLGPALEKVEPKILHLVQVFGNLATWAMENPKLTIGAAIASSIARAGLESALRSGIERLILGPNNSRAGRVGGAAAAVGGVLTLASLTASVITAASIYADNMYNESQQEFQSGLSKADQADALTKQIQQAMGAGDLATAEKLTKKQLKLRQGAEQDIKNSETFTGVDGFLDQLARGAAKTFIHGGEKAVTEGDKAVIDLMRQQHLAAESSKALLARIAEAIEKQGPPGGGAEAPPGTVTQ